MSASDPPSVPRTEMPWDGLLGEYIEKMASAALVTRRHGEGGELQQIVCANRAFLDLVGLAAGQVLGRTLTELTDARSGMSVFGDTRAVSDSEASPYVSMERSCKTGSFTPRRFRLTRVGEDHEDGPYWIWDGTEVSDPAPLDPTTKKSEERHRLAVEGANIGIWDWDIENEEIYFSPIWKSMLGYGDDEIANEFSEWTRLLHPDDLEMALSTVQAFLDKKIDRYEIEFRLQHKQGGYIHVLSLALAVENSGGAVSRLVGIHVDVTARRQAEKELRYQSTHDSLTGLVNRVEFERQARKAIAESDRERFSWALCYLDLDQFKLINDTCGHIAGDELLRQLGGIMNTAIRRTDTLARLGGDEFGVLIRCDSLDSAYGIASAIQAAIKDFPFVWEGKNFRVSASMGLVSIPGPDATVTQLLKNADTACFLAKDLGRDRIQVYQEDDMALSERHGEMQWVNRIQEALEQNRFVLYAQAIQSLKTDEPALHYEVLVRMLDEDGTLISPGMFLPAAERYSQIVQIDQWVLRNVFRLLNDRPEFLEHVEVISVNLSGPSLSDADFLAFVETMFEEHQIDGSKICFEITETAAMTHRAMADGFLAKVAELGCQFSLDDFGSGLSSYGYLKHLPVDYLKIDGMFVSDIVHDPIDFEIVKSINQIGHAMGMKTIAEFVENDEVKKRLDEVGLDFVQGFAIHKPQSLEEIVASF